MKFYELSLEQMVNIAKIVTGQECKKNFAPKFSVEEPEFPALPYVNLTWKYEDDTMDDNTYVSISIYENFDVILTIEPLEIYGEERSARNILEYAAYINKIKSKH